MHAYLRILLAGAGSFEKGQAHHVEVAHDASCGMYQQCECDCSPDIVVSRADGSRFMLNRDGSIMGET